MKKILLILFSILFVSVANAIVLRGATPIFAEVDPKNLNISTEDIKKKYLVKQKQYL